jgi:hypothetical protein
MTADADVIRAARARGLALAWRTLRRPAPRQAVLLDQVERALAYAAVRGRVAAAANDGRPFTTAELLVLSGAVE